MKTDELPGKHGCCKKDINGTSTAFTQAAVVIGKYIANHGTSDTGFAFGEGGN